MYRFTGVFLASAFFVLGIFLTGCGEETSFRTVHQNDIREPQIEQWYEVPRKRGSSEAEWVTAVQGKVKPPAALAPQLEYLEHLAGVTPDRVRGVGAVQRLAEIEIKWGQ